MAELTKQEVKDERVGEIDEEKKNNNFDYLNKEGAEREEEEEDSAYSYSGDGGDMELLLPGSSPSSSGHISGDNGDGSGGGGGGGSESAKQPLSVGQLLLLNLGWAGLQSIALAWSIVTIPSQVRSTVGDANAGGSLSLMVGLAGALIVILTPYLGLVSDATTSRYGRRRPFMVVGAIALSAFQIGMGLSNPVLPPGKTDKCSPGEVETHGNYAALATCYVLASLATQVIGVPFAGLIADRTPVSQRGISSGIQVSMYIYMCVCVFVCVCLCV